MLKSCPKCGRIHDGNYDCGHGKRIRVASQTEASAFRRKNKWTKISKAIRERDHYLCQVCIRNLYLTDTTLTHDGVSVHHIVPLAENGSLALDGENLITLCARHHELAESGYIPRIELQRIAREQERTHLQG